MKNNRGAIPALTDHMAASWKVQAAAGAWTAVSVYRGPQAADAVARGIRTSRIKAYRTDAGQFEAYASMCDDGTAVWARFAALGVSLTPMPNTITVRVPAYVADGARVEIVSVEISSRCQHCGAPRGAVSPHQYRRDFVAFNCDRWENECGHQDEYDRVLEEARRRLAGILDPRPKPVEPRGVEGGKYQRAVDLIADVLREWSATRAYTAVELLEDEGEKEAAETARAFVKSTPTGGRTSGKAVALYLMSLDTAAQTANDETSGDTK